jgi:hypothetical protein
MGWDKQDAIASIFNGFVKVFADSMNVIKPERHDPNDTERPYDERIYAWQKALTFDQELTIRIDGFANDLVFGGNPQQNLPDSQVHVNNKFVNELNTLLNSGKFNQYMHIIKPNFPDDDPRAAEKIKAWENSFNVTQKLQEFTNDVKNQIVESGDGYITLVGYFAPISGLIRKLESD